MVIDPLYEDGVLVGFAKITRDITERRDGAECAAGQRAQLPAPGQRCHRLRAVHARSGRTACRAGTPAANGSRATRRRKSSASISRASTPTQDQAAGRPARALSIARETGRYDEEGWRVRKDGSFFWASVVIDPIRDEDGKLIGYAKITRDITERREAQMELDQSSAAACRIAEDGCARPAHRRRGA